MKLGLKIQVFRRIGPRWPATTGMRRFSEDDSGRLDGSGLDTVLAHLEKQGSEISALVFTDPVRQPFGASLERPNPAGGEVAFRRPHDSPGREPE